MNIKDKPETDERRLQRLYRKRVAIFLFCVVLTIVVLSTVFDALQTWNRLEWTERQRDQWQRPSDVIQELNLKPGSVAVDLGSGVGYFTLKLSNTVGKTGKVVAVDILKFPLQVLRVRTLLSGQHNVDTILAEPDNPHLTAGSVDAVLIANTFHEIAHPSEVLDHLFQSLKPGGRLVIVDRGPPPGETESQHPDSERHEIAPDLVEDEIVKEGFEVIRRQDHFIDQPGEDNVWWLIVASRPLQGGNQSSVRNHSCVEFRSSALPGQRWSGDGCSPTSRCATCTRSLPGRSVNVHAAA